VVAKFTVNNKVYPVMRVLPFIVNYKRELRIEANISKKEMKRHANRE